MRKLHIDDWRRRDPEYKIAFQGERYHMVKEDNGSFKIHPNFVVHKEEMSPTKIKAIDFAKMKGHKPITDFSAQASNLDSLSVLSPSKQSSFIDFKKQTDRARNIFGRSF